MLLVCVSGADWMNVAHAQRLERFLIDSARLANRYDVENGTQGNDLHLGADDLAKVRTYCKGLSEVLHLAGIDLLEPNFDGHYLSSEPRGKQTFTSAIRILSTGAIVKICLLAGGSVSGCRREQVAQAGIPGCTYDAENYVHHFATDVALEFTAEEQGLWAFYGAPLSLWKSRNGVTLAQALRSLQKAHSALSSESS